MSARRLAAALLLAAKASFAAASFDTARTNDLAEAQAEGRDLARQLCELRPSENFTNASTLIIHPHKGPKWELPIHITTTLSDTNWTSVYDTLPATNRGIVQRVIVTHRGFAPNYYDWGGVQTNLVLDGRGPAERVLMWIPFANSDFWMVDLAMDFLHWPGQKLLKKELKKGQSCAVLESRNPAPATNTYSRVVSWIDIDTGGIVQADAYDARGKLLKEFELKEAEKVNGQWKVSELQMRNTQTGSRTTLKFNFGNP